MRSGVYLFKNIHSRRYPCGGVVESQLLLVGIVSTCEMAQITAAHSLKPA